MADEQTINVAITGSVDGLTTATAQAAEATTRAASVIQRETEGMASAFEGMGKRFEHTGVMAAFAISNLANDSEKGFTRMMHSIAMLGFAFGPVVGAITTAVAVILEQLESMWNKAEKQAKEFGKTLADAIRQGQAEKLVEDQKIAYLDLIEAQTKLKNIQAETPIKATSFLGPSIAELETAAAVVTSGRGRLKQAQDEVNRLQNEFKQLTDAITKASERASAMASRSGVGKVTITDDDAKQLREAERVAKERERIENEVSKALFEAHLKNEQIMLKFNEEEITANEKREEFLRKDAMKNREEFAKQVAELQKIMDEQSNAAGRRNAAEQARQLDELLKHYEKVMGEIGNLVNRNVDAVLRGTEKMSQAWRSMLGDVLRMMILNAEKSLEVWLATELVKRRTSAVTGKTGVMNQAFQAAAGAFSSTAQIPIIGPFLAPAAAAAAFAAVAAFGSGISAAGGFDVPAGVNPMTQLHAQEMVLPADIANPLRDMVAGGGGGGMTVHIHAMDAGSFRDFAHANSDTFHDAVTSAANRGRGM